MDEAPLSSLNPNIGPKVRQYRKLHRLTMQDLGAMLGTSHGYISQLESGGFTPGADVVYRLALALNVSADTLLGLPNCPKPSAG